MAANPEGEYSTIIERLEYLTKALEEVRELVGPFGVPFPDQSTLVQTLYRNKYFIDPSDLIMAPQLIVYRQWEPDISRYMIESVGPDTVFVDVGANFGYFSILAASRIGQAGKGRVIAIEPNPKMLRLLRKNAKINWSMAPLDIQPFAVSESRGYVRFRVPESAANASMVQPETESDDTFIVETRAIDEITQGQSVDIMKVDVEGFETFALRGARQTIKNSPAIQVIMEWSPGQMLEHGFRPADLLAEIREAGLSIYRMPVNRHLSAGDWKAHEIDEGQLGEMGYANLLLKHAS
jgi:FkbM family methyltransferase